MKFIYFSIIFLISNNLFAIVCSGDLEQKYFIDNTLHNQSNNNNQETKIEFSNQFKEIRFDYDHQLRINNEVTYNCSRNKTIITCGKRFNHQSKLNEIDSKTKLVYDLTATTKHDIEINYDLLSKQLFFNLEIFSDVTEPQKINSKEVAKGRFLCK